MIVGTLRLHLRLDGCFSLKDKRRLLRSILDRSRRDFHVAIAEVDDLDLWNSSVVGAAVVTNDVSHAESVLQHVLSLAEAHPGIEVEAAEKEIERR